MSDLTPNTDYMRSIYPDDPREFDRWIQSVRAEAWARGNQSGWCEGYSHSDPEPNPYL